MCKLARSTHRAFRAELDLKAMQPNYDVSDSQCINVGVGFGVSATNIPRDGAFMVGLCFHMTPFHKSTTRCSQMMLPHSARTVPY